MGRGSVLKFEQDQRIWKQRAVLTHIAFFLTALYILLRFVPCSRQYYSEVAKLNDNAQKPEVLRELVLEEFGELPNVLLNGLQYTPSNVPNENIRFLGEVCRVFQDKVTLWFSFKNMSGTDELENALNQQGCRNVIFEPETLYRLKEAGYPGLEKKSR